MKLLLDINVVLDVVLAREPWAQDAARLLSAVEAGSAAGYVAAHTITTIHYLVARKSDNRAAARAVTDLLRILHVVPLDDADFQQALVLDIHDFEDAVQCAAAFRIGASYLVTRNAKDFRGASIGIRTPAEVLALLRV